MATARRLFAANLEKLRNIAPVRTACMHGRALSKYHNLEFWKENSRKYVKIKNTPQLIDFISTNDELQGALLTHTHIWTDQLPVLMLYKLVFWGVNRIKYVKKRRMLRSAS